MLKFHYPLLFYLHILLHFIPRWVVALPTPCISTRSHDARRGGPLQLRFQSIERAKIDSDKGLGDTGFSDTSSQTYTLELFFLWI